MVIDENRIYVEKGGKLSLSGYQFKNVDHLMRIIERIVTPLGRRIDTSSPMVDARLADGSRVNAVIPPLAADAPCLTIRKFGKKIFTCDMRLKFSSLTEDMVEFAQACVMAASAVDIIVQTSRLSDGSRKIISITEVVGMKPDGSVELRDIFRFRQTGIDKETRKITGVFEPVLPPTFLEKMEIAGFTVPHVWNEVKEEKK